MNDNFENKYYDFFSKKENFEYAFDIHENFKRIVIDRLYDDFWKDLQKALENHFKKNYSFEKSEIDEWLFTINKKDWKIFYAYINWYDSDIIDYGIIFENKYKKKILNLIKEYELFQDLETRDDSEVYCYFKEFDEDFAKLNSLKRILPENRMELINEYVQQFEKFISKYNKDVLLIEKKLNESVK